jgi:hypothetical protein
MTTTAPPRLAWLIAISMLLSRQASAAGDAPVDHVASPQPTDLTPAALGVGSVAADCIPAWVIDADGIRRLPDRCPSAAGTAAAEVATPSAARSPAEPEPCEPPWFVDAVGIRRIRHECLAAEPEPPAATSSLVPSAPAALDGLDAPSDCDPMYWVDGRGIQRLRPECL